MLRLSDSLDDTYLVEPEKLAAIPGGAEERLRRFGSVAGTIGGAGLGALLPVALGAHTGERIGHHLHNVADFAGLGGAGDITRPLARGAGSLIGGSYGIPVMPIGAGLGGMLGYESGRSLGGVTGRAIDAMRSTKSKALAETRSLPLTQAHAYLQTARQLGTVDKDVLDALERDYQVRREAAITTGQSKAAFDMSRSAIAPAGVPPLQREGGRLGRGLGALASAGVAFGMPFLAAPLGASLGQTLQGAGHGLDLDLPEGTGKALGGAAGAATGALVGLRMLPERTILPLVKGSLAGRAAGSLGGMLEKLAPEHRQMVSAIQKLPPDEAYAFLKSVERAGNVAPETLQNIKASYEARRMGLAGGMGKVGEFDPLEHPATSPAPRRRLGRAGLLLGGLAGAGAGYGLGEYFFPAEGIEQGFESAKTEGTPENIQKMLHLQAEGAQGIRPFAQAVGAGAGGLFGAGAGYGIGKGLERIPLSRRERGINRIRDIKSPEMEQWAIEEAKTHDEHPNILAGMLEAQQARALARQDLAAARGYR